MANEQQRERERGTSPAESDRGVVGERERYGASPRSQRGSESTAVRQQPRGYPSSLETPGYRGAFLASPWELMRRMSEDLDRLFDTFQPGRFQGSESSGALWAPELEVERRCLDFLGWFDRLFVRVIVLLVRSSAFCGSCRSLS